MSRARIYGEGEGYFLRHDQVHTIGVSTDKPTCLFVLQYRDEPGLEGTRFFTKKDAPPSFSGLYIAPDLDQTAALIAKARALAGGGGR